MTPEMISVSTLNEVLRIRHGFFTRQGGVSRGLYASLNCGYGAADAPDDVAANRARAMAALDVAPDNLVTVHQQHTAEVAVIDERWAPGAKPVVSDAMVTNRFGVALGILTADCAPVLLADRKANVIGAAHAGWRGALAGILDNTVAAMVRLGAKPNRMVAAIGPCIAQRSYEVGPEFPAAFLEQDADNHFFFTASPNEGRTFFDLPGYVARRLATLSVAEVIRTPCDTFREESRFFSYRRSLMRGESDYGRNLSAIVLER